MKIGFISIFWFFLNRVNFCFKIFLLMKTEIDMIRFFHISVGLVCIVPHNVCYSAGVRIRCRCLLVNVAAVVRLPPVGFCLLASACWLLPVGCRLFDSNCTLSLLPRVCRCRCAQCASNGGSLLLVCCQLCAKLSADGGWAGVCGLPLVGCSS